MKLRFDGIAVNLQHLSLLLLLFLSFIGGDVVDAEDREKVKRADSLRQAIDAALMATVTAGTAQNLIDRHGRSHRLSTYCNGGADYTYPPYESLSSSDALRAVVDSGELIVQGVGPSNWGKDGDYTASPPTGFWPDYLDAVVERLSTVYSVPINVRRVYDEATEDEGAVGSGTDLSDMYYLINGLVQYDVGSEYNETSRHHYYLTSCPAAVRSSSLLINSTSDVTTWKDFTTTFAALSVARQVMGVLSTANRDMVSVAFPATTEWRVYESDPMLWEGITTGEVYGGMVTGGVEDEGNRLKEIDSGLDAFYGFLIRDRSCSSAHSLSLLSVLPSSLAALSMTLLITTVR